MVSHRPLHGRLSGRDRVPRSGPLATGGSGYGIRLPVYHRGGTL